MFRNERNCNLLNPDLLRLVLTDTAALRTNDESHDRERPWPSCKMTLAKNYFINSI